MEINLGKREQSFNKKRQNNFKEFIRLEYSQNILMFLKLFQILESTKSV